MRPSPRHFKDALYEQFARVGKALASPGRLELLDLLAQAPRTVDALAQATEMSTANASQHLQVLRAAGLVRARKDRLFVTCEVAGDDVAALYLAFRRVSEASLADVDPIARELLVGPDRLVPVGSGPLLALLLQ